MTTKHYFEIRPIITPMARRIWIAGGAVAVWCLLVAFGIREIYGYSTTTGARAEAPSQWPAESTLARSTSKPTIIMFAHPECPCTRASLTELATIVDAASVKPAIEIVFSVPGSSWTTAARIPGAVLTLDRDGTEAARFGAATSGHVVVYDAGGNLQFAGGITGSRGHAGDNVGRRMVAQAIESARPIAAEHEVFGCALR
jgi:hypothetical protein